MVGTESQINHPRPLLIKEGSTWSILIIDGAPQAHERLCGSVPAKNSIDHKERPNYRGVKELRELLRRCGLQISWRRELGEDPLPRGRSLRGPRSTSAGKVPSSGRGRSFKPPAVRSSDAVRRPPAVQ